MRQHLLQITSELDPNHITKLPFQSTKQVETLRKLSK